MMVKSEWTLWPGDCRLVHSSGKYIRLSRIRVDILEAIARAHGHVARRDYVHDFVWGALHINDSEWDEKTLDVHICKLRTALKPHVDFEIETTHAVGYSLSKDLVVKSYRLDTVEMCKECGRPFDAPLVVENLVEVKVH